MRIIKILCWELILFVFLHCNKNIKNDITIEHNLKGLHFYQIQCRNKIYISLNKGSCKNLPKDYLSPKGDSENYYFLFIRNKNHKLEVYSPYNDVIKVGKINEQMKIIEYKNYEDNVFIEDSIKGRSYIIDGTSD